MGGDLSRSGVLLVEPWGHGGTARYAYHLAEALAASGPGGGDVALLAADDFPYDPVGCEVVRGLPATTGTSASRVVNGARMARRAVVAQQAVVGALARRRPAVLHFSGTTLVTGRVMAAARRLGTRVVTAVHDLPTPGIDPARVLSLQWRQAFDRSDVVFVHGPWTATELERLYPRYPGAPVVLRYGPYWYGDPVPDRVAALRGAETGTGAPTRLLFFGSLRRNKGLSALLQALRLEIDGRFHLHVVGNRPAASEPSPETYQEEAASLGVADRTTWRIGYVPDADVADIFAASDVVVLPYGSSYNGFSAVLATAIAYRRPAVASAVGDTGQAVADYGLGVTAGRGEPEALLEALRRVAAAPEAFEDNLRSFATRFSWSAMADATWKHYRELLDAGAGRR